MKEKPQKSGFASLMKTFTNLDPYQCVLRGSRMIFNSPKTGIRAEELLARRRQECKTERWLRQGLPETLILHQTGIYFNQSSTPHCLSG